MKANPSASGLAAARRPEPAAAASRMNTEERTHCRLPSSNPNPVLEFCPPTAADYCTPPGAWPPPRRALPAGHLPPYTKVIILQCL